MSTHTPKLDAAKGLILIKRAVLNYIRLRGEDGARNIEIVNELELSSDYEGKNRNYLVWSIVGILLSEGQIEYRGAGRQKRYYIKNK